MDKNGNSKLNFDSGCSCECDGSLYTGTACQLHSFNDTCDIVVVVVGNNNNRSAAEKCAAEKQREWKSFRRVRAARTNSIVKHDFFLDFAVFPLASNVRFVRNFSSDFVCFLHSCDACMFAFTCFVHILIFHFLVWLVHNVYHSPGISVLAVLAAWHPKPHHQSATPVPNWQCRNDNLLMIDRRTSTQIGIFNLNFLLHIFIAVIVAACACRVFSFSFGRTCGSPTSVHELSHFSEENLGSGKRNEVGSEKNSQTHNTPNWFYSPSLPHAPVWFEIFSAFLISDLLFTDNGILAFGEK